MTAFNGPDRTLIADRHTRQQREEYELRQEIINGQAVMVKVYPPQPDRWARNFKGKIGKPTIGKMK